MLLQRQKIATVMLAALMKSDIGNILRAHLQRQVEQLFQAIGIGDGLDVENECGCHADSLFNSLFSIQLSIAKSTRRQR